MARLRAINGVGDGTKPEPRGPVGRQVGSSVLGGARTGTGAAGSLAKRKTLSNKESGISTAVSRPPKVAQTKMAVKQAVRKPSVSARAPSHGYAQSKVNFNASKPKMASRAQAITSLRAARATAAQGINLNPFDSKNVFSQAGRSVARGIPAGIGSRAISSGARTVGRWPGDVGNLIGGATKNIPNPLSLPARVRDWLDPLKNI